MSHPTDELRDLLGLHLVTGVGPRVMAGLLARFGSAARARQARIEELLEVPFVGPRVAEAIRASRDSPEVTQELDRVAQRNIRLFVRGGDGYPSQLVEIPDSPHILYVRGELPTQPAAAIVGSRHCTPYGRRMAARLATDLARAGITVVSGLARGIDGEAHRATLEAGGKTVAVLAGGLSSIYPPEHADLAEQVAATGALVTESCMLQDPIAGLFHARNRIISGLAQAVVIVEAAERSGALITASHAADQGRTVLAVPGPTDSAASGGCHALIRKGAILCRGADDVLEEIRGVSAMAQAAAAPPPPAGPPPNLDDMQLRLWEFLAPGIRSIDEMAQQLGVAVPQLTTALMRLEMRKIVKRLPGNRYERS